MRILLVLLLAGGAFALYARQLDRPPVANHPEESALARQARSLAQTGRDVEGERFPLFVHLRESLWSPPVPVYFTSLFLLPPGASDARMRTSSVALAALDVILIFAIGRRLFGGDVLASIAAGLIALMPAHFIFGRLAMASIYPVPFILLWLLCLIAFVQRRRPALLFAAALSLGIGFYAHPTSTLMMPIYLALTLVTAYTCQESGSGYAAALAGFGLPLLILIPWFLQHHATFRFTLGDWGLHTLANPADGLRYSIFSWDKVATRASVLWGFFSPSFLFLPFSRDPSAHPASLFLGLAAIPAIAGVYQVVVSRWFDPIWRVVLLGFVLAPVAAATFEEAHAMSRALMMVPFGVLLACAGFERLLSSRMAGLRVLAIAVLCLMPIEFYRFYAAYVR